MSLKPDQPPRIVESTQVEAYEDIKPSLPAIRQAVLVALASYHSARHHWPTANELFEFMRARGSLVPLNSVRSRLTELFHAKEVVKSEKRPCTSSISSKNMLTWSLPPRNLTLFDTKGDL